MATNLKTIKFGENGEVYNVNAFDVERNGELSESSEYITFGGEFEKGLTEINLVVKGVNGTSGDYIYAIVNGNQSGFITCGGIYQTYITVCIKRIGDLWYVYAYDTNGRGQDIASAIYGLLNGVSEINSISFQAFSTDMPFAAGAKYALEGR